jgi:hypothetical protein
MTRADKRRPGRERAICSTMTVRRSPTPEKEIAAGSLFGPSSIDGLLPSAIGSSKAPPSDARSESCGSLASCPHGRACDLIGNHTEFRERRSTPLGDCRGQPGTLNRQPYRGSSDSRPPPFFGSLRRADILRNGRSGALAQSPSPIPAASHLSSAWADDPHEKD